MLMLIFPQHDHAQHGATLSIRLVRSLMVWGRKVKSSCTINKARDASVKATNALTTGDKSGYLLVDWWKKEGHYCTAYNK